MDFFELVKKQKIIASKINEHDLLAKELREYASRARSGSDREKTLIWEAEKHEKLKDILLLNVSQESNSFRNKKTNKKKKKRSSFSKYFKKYILDNIKKIK